VEGLKGAPSNVSDVIIVMGDMEPALAENEIGLTVWMLQHG
jgi:hypothetical protein